MEEKVKKGLYFLFALSFVLGLSVNYCGDDDTEPKTTNTIPTETTTTTTTIPEYTVSEQQYLYHAVLSGTNWAVTLVDERDYQGISYETSSRYGMPAKLLKDSSNILNLIYIKGGKLYKTIYNTGSWFAESELTDSGYWRGMLDAEYNLSGNIVSIFYDISINQLSINSFVENGTVNQIADIGQVDLDYAVANSVAIDSNNRIHVSYYDPVAEELKYADGTSDIFLTKTIKASLTDPVHSSIAVNGNNTPMVTYTNGGNIYYASYDGANWNEETIDSGATKDVPSVIEFDPNNDRAYLCYGKYVDVDNEGVYLTMKDGSASWSTAEKVGGADPYDIDLAFDSNDDVHIAYVGPYCEGGLCYPPKVFYAKKGATDWEVDQDVSNISDNTYNCKTNINIVMDGNDNPHIVFSKCATN